MQLNKRPFKSWVEVSQSALFSNLRVFRKLVGEKTKIAAVVKANAYGHGISQTAPAIEKNVDWFAVDNYKEGELLRDVGIRKPILVLGYTPPGELGRAIKNNLSLTIYGPEDIQKILSLKLKEKAKFHLKVETGLNRQGVKKVEALKLAKVIAKNSNRLVLEGISTHFANIEDTLDASFAMEQLKEFSETVELLKKEGLKVPLPHSAASAAALLYPKTHFNMVRVGIALYGLWPSRETQIALSVNKKKSLSLKPALSWKSVVAQVKWVEKGESVGYGRTWFAPRKTKIAIIPVGYSDGYDRGLSGAGQVLIKGKKSPVIGRVAMNMITADITEIPDVKREDEVILIGGGGRHLITAEDIAERIGTINYEIVSRINASIPRVVTK